MCRRTVECTVRHDILFIIFIIYEINLNPTARHTGSVPDSVFRGPGPLEISKHFFFFPSLFLFFSFGF